MYFFWCESILFSALVILIDSPFVSQSLQDVTGAEFKMFVDFLKSFSIFGEKAPPERIQELIEIIEGQADLDAQFNVSDCMTMHCKVSFFFFKVFTFR